MMKTTEMRPQLGVARGMFLQRTYLQLLLLLLLSVVADSQ